MMRNEDHHRRVRNLARIAPIYGFMFFFGPVAWQLWMSLRLGFVSLEEARRCLLSPCMVCIAISLFSLNMANLAWGIERIGAGKDGAIMRRMAVHFVSLLVFATIGTTASMSMLSVSTGGSVTPLVKLIVGASNGASMCCVFYATSTAGAAACLVSPLGQSNEAERHTRSGTLAGTRAFNRWVFALGLPLFIATSLVAVSLSGRALTGRPMLWLYASMAVPVTMSSILFIRADRRLTSLRKPIRKEIFR